MHDLSEEINGHVWQRSKQENSVRAAYSYLEDSYKNDRAQLSSAVPNDIVRDSGHELQVQEVQVQLEEERSHHSAVQGDGINSPLECF